VAPEGAPVVTAVKVAVVGAPAVVTLTVVVVRLFTRFTVVAATISAAVSYEAVRLPVAINNLYDPAASGVNETFRVTVVAVSAVAVV